MKKAPPHISGALHTRGASRFIGDEPALPRMLHARLLLSPVAHAMLNGMDFTRARALPGVFAVLGAEDIPGENMIGHVIKDEPLFPEQTIMYIGQPLAMVLSYDKNLAEEAVKLIDISYEELPPILDVDTADQKAEWYVPERKIECGEVDKALAKSTFVLKGAIESAGQEHFYMETQRCRAVPGEGDQITLYSATQSTMEVQEVVSHVLGIAAHNVIVDVLRLGGAFGGKERNGTIYACLAALGAYICKRPVEILLTRDEDMLITGKRHPFKTYYQIGFEPDGKINALEIQLLANGGAFADLSIAILERAMFHADNAYYIPNARIRGRACRTNLPPNTAYRGFGAPQGIYVIESLIEQMAETLKIDMIEIRKRNTYSPGQPTPYGQVMHEAFGLELWDRLQEISDYDNLQS
ncbi:MAG: molybdopterin cofactor-binding domain-containing protein [Candidatus Cloacimonadaceae bacterium]|nr:molybdopterin cofactor-binding domain-containing protein [Candidatus Cloacimonadaceae bacterium]